MPTPTKDLRALVGKQVMIERDGLTHKGVLMREVFRRVRKKFASKRWVLVTETYFKANDGWTVTLLQPTTTQPARAKGRPEQPTG
jgi:hypothetical protein